MAWQRPPIPIVERFPSVWVIAGDGDGGVIGLETAKGVWTLPWANYYPGFYSWPETAVGNALRRHLGLDANFTERAVPLGLGAVVLDGQEVGNRYFYGVRLGPEELSLVATVEGVALLGPAEMAAHSEQNSDMGLAWQVIQGKRIQ